MNFGSLEAGGSLVFFPLKGRIPLFKVIFVYLFYHDYINYFITYFKNHYISLPISISIFGYCLIAASLGIQEAGPVSHECIVVNILFGRIWASPGFLEKMHFFGNCICKFT